MAAAEEKKDFRVATPPAGRSANDIFNGEHMDRPRQQIPNGGRLGQGVQPIRAVMIEVPVFIVNKNRTNCVLV